MYKKIILSIVASGLITTLAQADSNTTFYKVAPKQLIEGVKADNRVILDYAVLAQDESDSITTYKMMPLIKETTTKKQYFKNFFSN